MEETRYQDFPNFYFNLSRLDWANMHSHLISHLKTHTHTQKPSLPLGNYHLSIIMWSLWACNSKTFFLWSPFPFGKLSFSTIWSIHRGDSDSGYRILSRGMQWQDSMGAIIQSSLEKTLRWEWWTISSTEHLFKFSSSVFPLMNLLMKLLWLLKT